jgi:hypothetical protein
VGGVKLDEVMDEVARVMQTITGLRVFAYPVATLSAPAGYVSYPQSVDFDETYQRGTDQYTDLPIVLLAGKPTEKSSRDTIAAWVASTGPRSIKAAMEAHRWETCDDLTVTSAEFDVESVGGVPYLAAMFKATVVGPGED